MVYAELKPCVEMLNDSPMIITRGHPIRKVATIVSALAGAGIDSASALRKHWAEQNPKFLFDHVLNWVKKEYVIEFKKIWMKLVKEHSLVWKKTQAKSK